MVFKPLGGKKASIEYQLKNKTAKVLFGNPKLTQQLIDSSHFSQTYCGMVLSFEEHISPETETEILEDFMKVILGGLDEESLNILVVRHTDKRHPDTGKVRPDYHITVVETELQTGKHITIYEHIKDHNVFFGWERMVNIRHGLSRPDDPARRRTINIPRSSARDAKIFSPRSMKFVQAEVTAGRIQNRADVIQFLEQSGFAVPRQGKDYLTIEDKEGNRTRLKGLFYERGFSIEGLGARPTGSPASPDQRNPETLGDVEKRFSKLFAGRVAKFQKLYRRNRKKIQMAVPDGPGADGIGGAVQYGPATGERLDDTQYEPPGRGASPADANPGPVRGFAAAESHPIRRADDDQEPCRCRTQKKRTDP